MIKKEKKYYFFKETQKQSYFKYQIFSVWDGKNTRKSHIK